MNEWNPFEEKPKLDSVRVSGIELRCGDHVRLRPHKSADILDLALRGQTGVIEAIEHDYDGQVHVAVVLDNDPGRDLGALRQPGHRFFFTPDEVEAVTVSAEPESGMAAEKPRILVAGIGNIFLGDDAFGVEVVRRLINKLPKAVRVEDFGIRGFDLAYSLMESYETAILVDTTRRRGTPGTVYVIEPDLENLDASPSSFEGHSLDPIKVLAFVQAMGGKLNRVLVVGCEPANDGTEDGGRMELSAPVEAAVDQAMEIIESLVARLLNETPTECDTAKLAEESEI